MLWMTSPVNLGDEIFFLEAQIKSSRKPPPVRSRRKEKGR